jgi:hypothetical protein
MSVHHLRIADESERLFGCLLIQADIRPWTLEFANDVLGHATFSGPDLFECLSQLRQWLGARGYQILCYGARIDAWASSMSRQMGGARKVYVTRMGLSATRADLLPTFGEASLDRLGTVEEQAEYHKKWLESLR